MTPSTQAFSTLSAGDDFRDPSTNTDFVVLGPSYTQNGGTVNAMRLSDGGGVNYSGSTQVIKLAGTYNVG